MTTRPDVAQEAIVDFDHHSDAFNLNQQTVNADIRQRCPVAWNTNYDGFWYLSSYDAVSQTARDDATFSHKYEPNAEDGVDYQGEMGVPVRKANPPWASARSTATTTWPYGTRWRPSYPREPSRRCGRSWNKKRMSSSTKKSPTDAWI